MALRRRAGPAPKPAANCPTIRLWFGLGRVFWVFFQLDIAERDTLTMDRKHAEEGAMAGGPARVRYPGRAIDGCRTRRTDETWD